MRIYKGKVFDVEKRRKRLPNGVSMDIEMMRHNGAVVILPLNEGNIVFIREYRPVVSKWLYELPAGTMEKGESPMKCAVRELKEETGFTAKSIAPMFTSFSAPGVSTEKLYFFLAQGLKEGRQRLDEHEIIRTRELSPKRLLGMIKGSKIIDGKTIQGILYYRCFIE